VYDKNFSLKYVQVLEYMLFLLKLYSDQH